jgi:CheY-like chemotaxis protein
LREAASTVDRAEATRSSFLIPRCAQFAQKPVKSVRDARFPYIGIDSTKVIVDHLLQIGFGAIALSVLFRDPHDAVLFIPTRREPNAKRARSVPVDRQTEVQMAKNEPRDIADAVAEALPFLRRYARALTGSQQTGDNYAAATLEAILTDRSVLEAAQDPKVALFHAFHVVWSSAGAPLGEPDSPLSARAQGHMAKLTPNTREALLLNSVEGFRIEEIATIMQVDAKEAEELIEIAMQEMAGSIAGKVMIIEDEAIIAMDIRAIVQGMGHRVTGIARTRTEAVALADGEKPDLILADIQLADNSSGIDAVSDILAKFDEIPVIFITAFPERLLTGKRHEPAFLITKPYGEDQVRSAVSQAMFFASTDTLHA